MIQLRTKLEPFDNCGATKLTCIQVYERKKSRTGSVSSLISVSVKETIFKKRRKVQKGKVCRGIVTSSRAITKRIDGSSFRSNKNGAVLVTKQNNPLGSRLTSYVSYEILNTEFPKIRAGALYTL
jgi:large subunit ribosomal protein L14